MGWGAILLEPLLPGKKLSYPQKHPQLLIIEKNPTSLV
jgi:hypothetical protein